MNYAAGIKLDAERMLGQYLQAQPKAVGGNPSLTGTQPVPVDEPPTLAELGISKKLSAEAQRWASIPDDTFARVKAGEIKPMVALRDQRRAELVAFPAARDSEIPICGLDERQNRQVTMKPVIDFVHIMIASDVAEAFGVTPARIHQLDHVLRPIRKSNGAKRYDPRRVLALLEERKRNPAPRSRAL